MITMGKLEIGSARCLAWVPIPFLLGVMIALRALDLQASYESHSLAMVLNFITRTVASLLVVYLAGRSFLSSGDPGPLLLGCGVVIWGGGGFVETTLGTSQANIGVTITNVGGWLSGLCYMTGAILSLRLQRPIRRAGCWLAAGYAAALGIVGWITLATFKGWLPVFFVSGQGGTLIRQIVLGSAIILLGLTVLLTRQEGHRRALSSFAYWYELALSMIAVGFCGMMIDTNRDTLLDWTCRATQYAGGIYLFMAALALCRASDSRAIALEPLVGTVRHPYIAAIAMVVSATDLRLVFLQNLGDYDAFIMSYPAVMLAALYGGSRAGVLATLLSAFLADFFWLPTERQILQKDFSSWLSLAVFLFSGSMISWITGAMRRAQARAIAAEETAKHTSAFKRMAEDLKRERDLLQSVMDSATASHLVYLDPDFNFVRVNATYAATCGYRPEEMVGKNHFILYPNAENEAIFAPVRDSGETVAIHDKPFEFPDQPGRGVTYWDWMLSPVKNARGKVEGLIFSLYETTARKKAEDETQRLMGLVQQEKDRLSSLIGGISDEIWFADSEKRFVLANPSARKEFDLAVGVNMDVAKLAASLEVYRPDGTPRPIEEAPPLRALRGEVVRNQEEMIRTPRSGEVRYRQVSSTPVHDGKGGIIGSVSVVRDITESKQINDRLKNSLREKDVLLKELHHRVKNNLQVISSLVSLQADAHANPSLRDLFENVQDQVRTMALVHEKLYQNEDIGHVEFADYARSLLQYLWRAHGTVASDVKLTLDLQPVSLTVEAAVPCGLMLNELASNSLKHAFRGRSDGEVCVSLHSEPDGRVRLCVGDNGVGMPAGLDWRKSQSFGLRLVQMLAGQLNGTVEMRTDGGTKFEVIFERAEKE